MQPFFQPAKTPRVIKWLIWIIASCSLLYPILTYFFLDAFKIRNFGLLFPLSWMGVKQGFIWQLVTYLFVQSVGVAFSLWFLISLFFILFILWFAGCEVAERYGPLKFLLFFLGGGCFAGLIALLYFVLFNKFGLLVGAAPAVFALITVWGMIYPQLNMALFFVLRMQAKWIVLLLLGITLLFNLLSGDFVYFVAELAGIIWGFCIGRFVWKLPNPYFRGRLR